SRQRTEDRGSGRGGRHSSPSSGREGCHPDDGRSAAAGRGRERRRRGGRADGLLVRAPGPHAPAGGEGGGGRRVGGSGLGFGGRPMAPVAASPGRRGGGIVLARPGWHVPFPRGGGEPELGEAVLFVDLCGAAPNGAACADPREGTERRVPVRRRRGSGHP